MQAEQTALQIVIIKQQHQTGLRKTLMQLYQRPITSTVKLSIT